MGKILEREITNEDGDFYGVCGDITRLGAWRAIRQDLRGFGILEDMEDDENFKMENLKQFDFYRTTKCSDGEHLDWLWWGLPKNNEEHQDEVEFIGKGWGYKCF